MKRAVALLLVTSAIGIAQECPTGTTRVTAGFGSYCAAVDTNPSARDGCPAGTSRHSTGYGSYCGTAQPQIAKQYNSALLSASFCPKPVSTADPPAQAVNHNGREQGQLLLALGTKNPKERALLLDQFLSSHPDSNYRDNILIAKISTENELKNWEEEVKSCRQLLASPTANGIAFFAAYLYLADTLPILYAKDHSAKESTVEEVAGAAKCGAEMLTTLSSDPRTAGIVAGSKAQAELSFTRARGWVALEKGDYLAARQELQRVVQMNSQDARAYLLLASAQLADGHTDTDTAIFNLARACALSPNPVPIRRSLIEIYKIQHGSEKGYRQSDRRASSSRTDGVCFRALSRYRCRHCRRIERCRSALCA